VDATGFVGKRPVTQTSVKVTGVVPFSFPLHTYEGNA
jgi:hypothetical protein